MTNLTIKDLYKDTKCYDNKEVIIEGWVKTIRDSKTFGFIELNDGSFFKNVQIVFNDNLSNFENITKLTISSTIKVTGKVIITENAKQPFEIQATSIEIEALSPTDYPLQKKRHSFEYLRTIAHLRPRTNTFNAVFRIRSVTAFAIHQYFQERGYVYVHSPIITCADCEGSAEMFKLTTFNLDEELPKKDGKVDFSEDLFGKKAYITKARVQLMRDLGSTPSPFSAFLLNNGLETLHLRMERHSQNALRVAEHLKNHPKVAWVSYPGLESDKYHALALKYLDNGYSSGVVSFGTVNGKKGATVFMDSLRLAKICVHVADLRTCVLHPASTTHRQLTDEQLIKAGVKPEFIRFSTGIENIDDIIADIDQALEKI